MPGKTYTEGGTYNRKPYMDESGDYIDQMKRPSRRAVEIVAERPRSNFDKPYAVDDYTEMEYIQPPPFPKLNDPRNADPEFAGIVPTEEEWPPPGALYNMIVNGPHMCCCLPASNSKVQQFCHAQISMSRVPSAERKIWQDHIKAYQNGERCTIEKVTGPRPVEILPNGRWYDGDEIRVVLKLNDKVVATEEITITCSETDCCNCDDPPEGVFTFDDGSTSDTIVAGSSIDVYVTGGCGPFTWSVAGAGYSFVASETDERVNTLNCAAGTCGVNFAAVASITVTDDCGETVTTKIRNTAGSWGSYIGCSHSTETYNHDLIFEDKRYYVSWSYSGTIPDYGSYQPLEFPACEDAVDDAINCTGTFYDDPHYLLVYNDYPGSPILGCLLYHTIATTYTMAYWDVVEDPPPTDYYRVLFGRVRYRNWVCP